MGAHQAGGGPRGAGLTASELRLLPLLATQLSLNEISQILDMPRDAVVALAQSIYAKLGPSGEGKHLTGL